MNYHFSKFIESSGFEEAVEYVIETLKTMEFGIITEIDVKSTLKEKIDVDFRNYKILGACNPTFAHQALIVEDKIGVFLPCNFVVQEHQDGKIEVSAFDPMITMSTANNEDLIPLAIEIQDRIKNVMESL